MAKADYRRLPKSKSTRKWEPARPQVREAFGEAPYLAHLETLVMKIPHAKQMMVGRRKLFASWAKG